MHKAPHSWLAYIFVHAPMRLFLAMLFLIDWLDNGFMCARLLLAASLALPRCADSPVPSPSPQSPYSVLGWENRDPATYARYSWQAVGIVAGCHLVGLIWVFLTRDAGASLQAPSTRAAACD
jgi:hypothetical protein